MNGLKLYIRNLLVPTLAWFIINIISKSLKIEFMNGDIVERLRNEGKRIIYVLWHGKLFLATYTHRKKNIVILTSLSKDGDMLTAILEKFGYKCVRGSSSRGGTKALREMIRAIREGYDCAVAVDGPKGPLHEVKPGAIFLSQLTEAAIVPVTFKVEKKKVFEKSWDKFELPMPFSKARVVYGTPFYVNRGDDISQRCIEIGAELSRFDLENKHWP